MIFNSQQIVSMDPNDRAPPPPYCREQHICGPPVRPDHDQAVAARCLIQDGFDGRRVRTHAAVHIHVVAIGQLGTAKTEAAIEIAPASHNDRLPQQSQRVVMNRASPH